MPTLNTGSYQLEPFERALIEKAHSKYKSILLEKEFGAGYSQTRVFLVLPVRANGTNDARLVTKIGAAEDLKKEKNNYKNLVEPKLRLSTTRITAYCQIGEQAAINYTFAGDGSLGETIMLEEYYLSQPAETVIKTLRTLLIQTLGRAWYGQTSPYTCMFNEEYGRHLRPKNELAQIVSDLYPQLVHTDDKHIQLFELGETYPDPLALLPDLLNRPLRGRSSVVHGDLHVRNILIDEGGRGWPIDFAKVHERHNLFDFIKLETYLRLFALARVSSRFAQNDYMQFEQALNAATLKQKVQTPTHPELARAFHVILTIRQIAQNYMGPEPDFKNEYFPALFLYTLSMLKYFSINKHEPTRLMFMTCCSLARKMEEKTMTPTQDDNPSKPSTPANSPRRPSPNGSSINIGGNATGSVIISGNSNKVTQTNINGKSTTSHEEIAAIFADLKNKVNGMNDGPPKTIATVAVEGLENEAWKGDNATENNVGQWFNSLAAMAPDIWQVAVDSFINPIKGLSTVFEKIAKKAKAGR